MTGKSNPCSGLYYRENVGICMVYTSVKKDNYWTDLHRRQNVDIALVYTSVKKLSVVKLDWYEVESKDRYWLCLRSTLKVDSGFD